MTATDPRPEPEQLASLRRQRKVLAEFGKHALRTNDLDALLHEACARVSEALEIELVKVLELLPDGQTLLVRAGVNWQPGVVGHATLGAHEHSPGGHALVHRQPVISPDVGQETRFEIPQLLVEHGVRSMVNVVIGDDGAFGVLEVDAGQRRDFDDDDVSFLQNYANLIAAAIERLHAHRELAELARTREVLMQELRHRASNILTNIRSILMRTRRRYGTADELVAAVDDRITALARTQDLLTRAHTGEVSLRELLRLELAAHGADEQRHYGLEGGDLALRPEQVQALCLVFHELATNAVKHGALADDQGRIAIRWWTDPPGQLHICWRETGVRIPLPPREKGFGSEIIEESVPYMLEGRSRLLFHPDGAECLLSLPLASAEGERRASAP